MPCLHPVKVNGNSYPCGKCYFCIRQKQMDYAQLLVMQCNKMHSAHFVTFTYDNAHRPIKSLDRSTGEVRLLNDKEYEYHDYCFSFDDILRHDYYKSIHDLAVSNHWKKDKYVHITRCDGMHVLCASLHRKDWRMWLKRSRVAYERKYGKKLPDFTYFCVGEYGERTYIPHYHAMFFGLKKEHLDFMCQDWKERFGFVLVKELPLVSSMDVSKTCLYVSKYLNKGCTDCPELFIKDSLMEKPRVMGSIGLSARAGTLDLFTLNGSVSLIDSKYRISDIDRIIGRLDFTFGDKRFIMGKHFYRYALKIENTIFQYQSLSVRLTDGAPYQTSFVARQDLDEGLIYITSVPHEVSICKYKASPLQVAISCRLSFLASQRDSSEKSRQMSLFYNSPSLREVFGTFEAWYKAEQLSREEAFKQTRQKSVSKSVF